MKLKRVVCLVMALAMTFTQADLTAFAASADTMEVADEVVEEVIENEELPAENDELLPKTEVEAEFQVEEEETNFDLIEETEVEVNTTDESSEELFKWNEDEITGISESATADALKDIVFPSRTTSIKNDFLYGVDQSKIDAIETIVVPTSVVDIGVSAFTSCTNLKSITFESGDGDALTLRYSIVAGCEKLETITLCDRITALPQNFADGCTSLKTVAWSKNLTSIGKEAFLGCSSLQSADLSQTQVSSIGVSAFDGCSALASVVFPETITQIDNMAFRNCALGTSASHGTIVIPKKVDRIGFNAFLGSKYLGAVEFTNNETENFTLIFNSNGGQFKECPELTSITLSDNVEVIPENFAQGDKLLKTVVWGQNLSEIGAEAFEECSSLESADFSATKLEKVNIYAFRLAALGSSTKLGELKLPGTIKFIGVSAFSATKLGKVVFADADEVDTSEANKLYDSNDAFRECPELREIVFSNNFTVVPYNFATWCPKLQKVDMYDTNITEIGTSAFAQCPELSDVKLPKGIKVIESEAFSGCAMGTEDNMTTLTLPATLERISVRAFSGCKYINKVVFPDDVNIKLKDDFNVDATSIFYSCENLQEVVLSNTIKSIPGNMFEDCTSLTKINLPSDLVSIGDRAFRKCPLGTADKMYDLVIPNTLTYLGSYAFSECKYLRTVTFEDADEGKELAEGISYDTYDYGSQFSECENLVSIKFSNNVKSIPFRMCYEDSKLVTIVLPASVTSIVSNAFYVRPPASGLFASNVSGGSPCIKTYNWEDDFRKIVQMYTITLNANGGEGADYATSLASGKTYKFPANTYTNAGYVFTGWNTVKNPTKDNPGVAQKNLATFVVKEDVTYYAQWRPAKFTVVFNKNNKAATGTMNKQTLEYASDTALTTNAFVRTGFTFAGWNTKADGTGTSYAPGAVITNDATIKDGSTINLFAQWAGAEKTVNFNVPDGVTLVKGESAVDVDTKKLTVRYEASYGTLPTATKANAIFIGWFDASENGTLVEATTEVLIEGEDITLYPYFLTNETIAAPSSNIANNAILNLGDKIYLSSEDAGTSIAYSLIDKNADVSTATLETAYTDTITVTEDLRGAAFTNGVKLVAVANKGELLSTKYVVDFTINAPDFGDIEKLEDPELKADIKTYLGNDVANIPEGLWIYEPIKSFVYCGGAITTKNIYKVYVFYGKNLLTENVDYTVAYKNNTNAGDALVTIKGKGSYGGSLVTGFTIKKMPLSLVNVSPQTLVAGTKVQKVAPTLTYINILEKTVKLGTKDVTVTYLDERENAYKAVGTWNVKLEGKGNFEGTLQGGVDENTTAVERIIAATDFERLTVTFKNANLNQNEYFVTGENIVPVVEVKLGSKKLKESKDYTVAVTTEADETGETGKITITGAGDYEGQTPKVVDFKVVGKNIATAVAAYDKTIEGPASGDKDDVIALIGSKIKVYTDATKETEIAATNYNVLTSCRTTVGSYTVTIAGKNAYAGTMKKFTIKVTPYDLAAHKDLVTIETPGSAVYVKGGLKLASTDVVVKVGLQTVNPAYYTVKTVNGTAARAADSKDKKDKPNGPSVTITGKTVYKGSASSAYFTIAQQNLSNLSASAKDIVYKASAGNYKSAIVITDLNGKNLTAKTDYNVLKADSDNWYYFTADTLVGVKNGKAVKYVVRTAGSKVQVGDIVPAGTRLQVKTEGTGNYTGTISAYFRVAAADIAKATIKINAQAYNGNTLELDKSFITSAAIGKTALTKDTDFEIVAGSFKNNGKAGSASFTIRGLGNYGGTKVVSFKITAKSMNYVIKYDANGGTGKAMKNGALVYGGKLAKCGYKMEGKTFKGWAYSASATEPDFAASATVSQPLFTPDYKTKPAGSEITLYAIWQ